METNLLRETSIEIIYNKQNLIENQLISGEKNGRRYRLF